MFREQSNRDPLTGLLTRRALTESMLARLAEAHRAKRHLSVCVFWISIAFKLVNDTYGHAVGDQSAGELRYATGLAFPAAGSARPLGRRGVLGRVFMASGPKKCGARFCLA